MFNLFKKKEEEIKTQEIQKSIKPIVTSLSELQKPCFLVENKENISQIIQDLKDTLKTFSNKALGLSANQIGYNKQIAYIRIPKEINEKTNEVKYNDFIIINPKIIEKARKIIYKKERCLSLPGIAVDTDRYAFVALHYCDENFKEYTAMFQDLEALVIQHEIGHLQGKTIYDFKHVDINKRKK
jgi:peptide deformylase